MTQSSKTGNFSHGPENAEHEIRKAYNCINEVGVTYHLRKESIPGVNPQDAFDLYKHCFQQYRQGNRLAAERWARTAKHLARALWHEAKIAYLEPRIADFPFLEGALAEEYNLHEHSDTTADLLDSVVGHIPAGLDEPPQLMRHYLTRAREHLKAIESPEYKHELLRAERIKAAHEYGRVLECMELAYEAEHSHKKVA